MPEHRPEQDTVGSDAPLEETIAEQSTEQAEATADQPQAAVGDDSGATLDEGEASFDAELNQLQAELEQAREQALRAQAEVQNIRRRAEQDVEKARKYALERFSSELLPVVDNLERALESASGDDETLRPIAEGVELTLKSFLDALRKFNIEPLDPHGEPFDPNLHQAMSMVENPEVDPNSVLAVMQKGYTLNGRLLRPAMVMVSKAPA